jgi:syntaxin 17
MEECSGEDVEGRRRNAEVGQLKTFRLHGIEAFLTRQIRVLQRTVDELRRTMNSDDAINCVERLSRLVDRFDQIRQQVVPDDRAVVDCRLALALNDVAHLLVELLSNRGKATTTEQVADDRRTEETSADDQNDVSLQSILAARLELKLLELNDKLQCLYIMIERGTTRREDIPKEVELVESDAPRGHFSVSNLKLLMMPVAGAVIGGVIGGPVGLVAGIKVGKIAAVSGGLIGLTGGTMLKKKTEEEQREKREPNNESRRDENIEMSQSSPLMSVV